MQGSEATSAAKTACKRSINYGVDGRELYRTGGTNPHVRRYLRSEGVSCDCPAAYPAAPRPAEIRPPMIGDVLLTLVPLLVAL